MTADARTTTGSDLLVGDPRTGPTGTVRRLARPATGTVAQDEPATVIDVRDERLGAIGSRRDLLDELSVRTARLVGRLRELGDLDRGTLLDGWSRSAVACHLRHGAETSLRLTLSALHEQPASWYPSGRPRQRPGTLRPRPGEGPDDVLRSLEATSSALQRVWEDLRDDDWARPVLPVRTEDPRDLTVDGLLVLRVTEVEVHGTDLAIGLREWSAGFVTAALPFRLRRLDGRWPAVEVERSWLLDVRGGPTWVVHLRGAAATAAPVTGPPPPADATITGEPRDVVALLLGRVDWDRLVLEGDVEAARSFGEVFPGP